MNIALFLCVYVPLFRNIYISFNQVLRDWEGVFYFKIKPQSVH